MSLWRSKYDNEGYLLHLMVPLIRSFKHFANEEDWLMTIFFFPDETEIKGSGRYGKVQVEALSAYKASKEWRRGQS